MFLMHSKFVVQFALVQRKFYTLLKISSYTSSFNIVSIVKRDLDIKFNIKFKYISLKYLLLLLYHIL